MLELRQDYDKLLGRLMALGNYAKHVHYNSAGQPFYGLHLLADRIYEEKSGHLDRLRENVYLGAEELPPDAIALTELSLPFLPNVSIDNKVMLTALYRLLKETINFIEDLDKKETRAISRSIIEAIGEELTNNAALLWRTLQA